MEPISVKVTGRFDTLEFYPDDTIDAVRQLVALAVDSHPDRLFLEVKASLPGDYYLTNPKHWTDLFLRMSMDGERIPLETMRTYLSATRQGTAVAPREFTREEWEARESDLEPLFAPGGETFTEWRILGVQDVKSIVLPLPPRDVSVPSSRIPIPQVQSLYETLHPYPIHELRVTVIEPTTSEIARRVYFPLFRPDTPNTIESLRSSLDASRSQFKKLLDLKMPRHESSAIVKAKWYVPFLSTKFTAPRSRFEQMFYGLTVSKTTPYVGFFTAKGESLRHKFYVENPKEKKPLIDTSLLRGWLATTMPQRRKPTLLLYRGTSRTSFDRIAVTNTDITVDVRRDKDSKATLSDLRAEMSKWIETLDAVMPFVEETDRVVSRWELAELSMVASYKSEIKEFDMRRFSCLQSLFGVQNDMFRLLRAEHSSDEVSPRILQAYQILTQDGAERTPEYLAAEMETSVEEAEELINAVSEMAAEFNFEKSLKAYPTLKFSGKEVLVKFVTNPERILHYADILRFVLTSDSDAVNEVCPRRLEEVAPQISIPQQDINVEEEEADMDLLAALGIEEEPVEEEAPTTAAPVTKARKLKVGQRTKATYNYFNNRLQAFDPETFDKSIYPGKCDKPKQVIALTPADKDRMGRTYNYEGVPDSEKLELEDPTATVICPPYWCMRDEIPLKEDQLKLEEDGELHCPVCGGKVRPNDNADTLEYTVIKRDTSAKFPDYLKQVSSLNKRKIPCCYQQPRSATEVLSTKEDDTYILKEDAPTIPGGRIAYLSSDLAERLLTKTRYETTVKKGRLGVGESDVFRIGLGRPSKTLPLMFGDSTLIRRPSEARENLMRCSFFRTWTVLGLGDTQVDRIVSGIDAAYESGSLSTLQELEYVTTFLRCEVIIVNTKTQQVECGFWSDSLGPNSRTIAVLDKDVLGSVTRVKTGKNKLQYTIDLRKAPFGTTTWTHLTNLHKQSCSIGVPTLADALVELQTAGYTEYQVILDPFDRIQAVFVPGEVLLPVLPSNTKPMQGVTVRSGYADLTPDELPEGGELRAFLKETKHPGFKKTKDNQNLDGEIVEFELASGFRIPVQPEEPEEGPDYAAEVTETIRIQDEQTLVDGKPNTADLRQAQVTAYSTEIYEFLLFSLSKDIQNEDYGDLRTSIVKQSPSLYKDLDKWFKAEAYEDTTDTPLEFINKVRTPCGQFKQKDTCNKSSLCGWHKNDCKIKVKPIVEKADVLKRIVKTLKDNDKQRALVLEARLSPFFSTILYLEMPHEWITNAF